MIQMRNELNEKISETRQLQMELNRLENEDVTDVGSLKRVIATLEKENAVLKVCYFFSSRFFLPFFMPNMISGYCNVYFVGFVNPTL